MTWKTRKKHYFLASIICWELKFSHIPRRSTGAFPCHPHDRALLLTGVAVHGDPGADGLAAALAALHPAVGNTLVLLADTRCKRSAAVSRGREPATTGHRARQDEQSRPSPAGRGVPAPSAPPRPPALPSRAPGLPSGLSCSLHAPAGRGTVSLPGDRRGSQDRGARSGAGRTEGRSHSQLWAETAAQNSSSRSAAPQSGFMAGEGGGARKSRGRVLGDAGRERPVCARQRRRSGVSRPTGSAGGGGCAAPSRLRLHLGRAGGAAAAAAAPPPSPPGALLNQRRARLPPHLGETGWGRAGPAPGPAPTAPLLRNGNGKGERRARGGLRRGRARFLPGLRNHPACKTAPPVKPPRLGGGAAGRGRCGEPGHSCPHRRGESVSHGRELPGVFAP